VRKRRQNDAKVFQRGERIYGLGEPAEKLFIVQSGMVSLTYTEGGRSLEVVRAIANSLIGEEVLCGAPTYRLTAIAVNPTSVIEIPAAAGTALLDSAPAETRSLIRALAAKEDAVCRELKALKLEDDTSTCPPELLAKLFAVVYQVASYTGADKKGARVVNWLAFRKYCQRIFLESPVRVEQVVYLLSRAQLAKLEMVKSETDPDGPEELGFVHFFNLDRLKRFSDFCHQRYAFEKTWAFEDDDRVFLAEAAPFLEKLKAASEAAQKNEITLPIDQMPQTLVSPLQNTPRDLCVTLSDDRRSATVSYDEFSQTVVNWTLLNEIDEWIRNGRVQGSPAPDPTIQKAKALGQRHLK
jgi:CRP-like cAMP-binding protein